MAIKIFERYGPRANPADGDYPNGSIKNESSPGTDDGTPLEQDWGNDYEGWSAALLDEADTIASGVPDTVGTSQRMGAMRKLFGLNVDHIKQLSGMTLSSGIQYNVVEFYDGSGKGGGSFIYDSTRNKADHNGITVIDPDRLTAWNGTQSDLTTYYTNGSGVGCFIRINYDYIDIACAGAMGDGGTDDSQSLSEMSSVSDIFISDGVYKISQNTTLTGKVKFTKGALLSIDAGVTLTISDVEADYSQQIFSGDGDVAGLQNSWVGWFGAVPDNSTDSSTAFNKAVQASSGAVYIPETNLGFRVLQTINLNKQIEIRGMNQSKITIGSGIDLFTVSASEIFISGLRLFGVDGTSHVCRLASSVQSIEFVYLEKIYTTACGRFIYDDNDPSNLVINLHVTDCYHRFAKDRGVWLRDAFAFVFFRKFAIDYVGVSDASSNVPAIQIENNEGSFFEDIDILGGTIAGFSGRDGFIAKNSAAVFLRRLNSDTMGGRGIVFEAANASRMETVASSLCGEDSIIITGCVSVMGCNVYVGGRKDLGGAAGKRGIVIDNTSTLVNLSNVSVLNLTGDGYVTDAITSIVNGINFNNIGGNNYNLATATNHLVAGQNTAGNLILNDTGPSIG